MVGNLENGGGIEEAGELLGEILFDFYKKFRVGDMPPLILTLEEFNLNIISYNDKEWDAICLYVKTLSPKYIALCVPRHQTIVLYITDGENKETLQMQYLNSRLSTGWQKCYTEFEEDTTRIQSLMSVARDSKERSDKIKKWGTTTLN